MGYIEEIRALVGKRPLISVGAGVCVLDGQNQVLLQRRSDNGLWNAPSGIMEPGESLEQTARRELLEEAGLQAGELKLFAIASGAEDHYTYPNGDECYFVTAFFTTREVFGIPKVDGEETLELRYFTLDDLPPLTINDQNYLPQLREKLTKGEL